MSTPFRLGADLRTPRRFLLLSLVLHSALLAALCLRCLRHSPDIKLTEHAVWVDFPNGKAASPKPYRAKPGRRDYSIIDEGSRKNLPLSALAPSWKARPGVLGRNSSPATDGWEIQDSDSIVSPKFPGAMTWVYQKVEASLGYPQPFIGHGIEGSVTAHFRFNSFGKVDRSVLNVASDSPYLRVYVYRLLEKTFFDDPIPGALLGWKDSLDVVAQVQFTIVETGKTIRLENKISGKRLYFIRQHEREIMAWKLGPLSNEERSGLTLDLLWFAKRAQQTAGPQTSADELADYRNDPLFYN